MARKSLGIPLVVLVALSTTGWLYVFRPALPGPQVRHALPLDELSRHSSTSLLWFVSVWGSAAVLIGLYARWARLERMTAAVIVGVAVGVWTYLQVGISLAIVRQIPLQDALDAAGRMHVVYLSGALCALGVAALATPRSVARSPLVISALVAIAGLLNLVHAVLPGHNSGLLPKLTPDAVGPFAHAAAAFAAVATLVAARGLARRRHRAWQVATTVTALSTLVHVLHGLNQGTLVSVVVLILLVARRHDFDGPGDASSRGVVARRAGTAAAVIVIYSIIAVWLNRTSADQPLTLRFASRETIDGLLGIHLRGSPHFVGAFAEWFPLSLLLLGIGSTLWIVAGWVAPWRHRVVQQERERAVARALVHAWGVDTLAPFVLRADKSYYFTPDESAFLAYRVVGGVAIVSGDPIGPDDRLSELIGSFVSFAHKRDWRLAILGASERCLPLYAAHGLNALYHGDEAIVDTASFSLEGRAIRKVRQSVHRLEGAGFVARALRPSEIDASLRHELERVLHDWRGGQPERGFVMALDALFSLGDEDAVFVVGFDPGGAAAGFLHFAISTGALSLSSMPRLRDTPNGFNEWLICVAVAWARANGYERVSLNFAPFAALLAPEAQLSGLQEVQRRALLTLKGHFQLDNLLTFNRKFLPRWERRFVVYERRRDLPRVGIAALAAEAYLPFQNERK